MLQSFTKWTIAQYLWNLRADHGDRPPSFSYSHQLAQPWCRIVYLHAFNCRNKAASHRGGFIVPLSFVLTFPFHLYVCPMQFKAKQRDAKEKLSWQIFIHTLRMVPVSWKKDKMKENRGTNGYDGKTWKRFLCSWNDEISGGSHAGALHVQIPNGRVLLFLCFYLLSTSF